MSADDLVQPIFVVEDPAAAGPIQALPGIERHSLDSLDGEIDRIASGGVRAVLVFGIPADKDSTGASATKPDGIVPAAVRRIRSRHPGLLVITDVCLCSYTDHGHCGVSATGASITTKRWRSWRPPPWPMRGPAPTSWRRAR